MRCFWLLSLKIDMMTRDLILDEAVSISYDVNTL